MEMVHIDLQVESCNAEVFLNGIPVGFINHKKQTFLSLQVHKYLLNGENELELIINPGKTPSTARSKTDLPKPSNGMIAKTRITRYKQGEYADGENGTPLCEIIWTGNESDIQFPLILKKATQITRQNPPTAWPDADKIKQGNKYTNITRQKIQMPYSN